MFASAFEYITYYVSLHERFIYGVFYTFKSSNIATNVEIILLQSKVYLLFLVGNIQTIEDDTQP